MAPESYYPEPVEAVLRHFVEDFRNVYAREGGTTGLLPALRAPVDSLLHDPAWVSEQFRRAIPGTTATYAIYRSQDPDLCIFTMAVAPGESTKVHNHLTDGWVGLIEGAQTERKYRRVDDGWQPGHAKVELVAEDPIGLGELTPIAHPDNDIHQIFTTSREASVSLHVLCSDLGTVTRQTFDVDSGAVEDFVSGYTNVHGSSRIGTSSA